MSTKISSAPSRHLQAKAKATCEKDVRAELLGKSHDGKIYTMYLETTSIEVLSRNIISQFINLKILIEQIYTCGTNILP